MDAAIDNAVTSTVSHVMAGDLNGIIVDTGFIFQQDLQSLMMAV